MDNELIDLVDFFDQNCGCSMTPSKLFKYNKLNSILIKEKVIQQRFATCKCRALVEEGKRYIKKAQL